MAVIQSVSAIRLDRVSDVLLECVLGNAGKEQVPRKIRDEGQARIACDERALNIEGADRVLAAQGAKLRDFALVFIQRLTRVGRYAVDGQTECGLLPIQAVNLPSELLSMSATRLCSSKMSSK